MTETLIHQRVAAAERGENPTVICRMKSGWLVMCDLQTVRGWCILISVPIVDDLHHLTPQQQAQFAQDMTAAGAAIMKATGAYRMNYSILGNTDPAVHAHLQPRFADEPEELRKQPLWAIWSQLEKKTFDSVRDEPLMEAIRTELNIRGVGSF